MVIMIRDQVGMAAIMVVIMETVIIGIFATGIMTGNVAIGIVATETMEIGTGATMIVAIEIMTIIETRVIETVIGIRPIETIRLEILAVNIGDSLV